MHSFSGSTVGNIKLVGRARQFSSFILMIGRIGGPNLFEPKHAIIVKDKDELIVPLLLEQIPAPKEFQVSFPLFLIQKSEFFFMLLLSFFFHMFTHTNPLKNSRMPLSPFLPSNNDSPRRSGVCSWRERCLVSVLCKSNLSWRRYNLFSFIFLSILLFVFSPPLLFTYFLF